MRLPRRAYASWFVRVCASVIDAVPIVLAWIAWQMVALGTGTLDCVYYDGSGLECSASSSRAADVALGAIWVLSVGYLVWNFGFRQGTRGSSIGKSVLKIKVVSERTWQPIGFARSVVRQLAHILDAGLCFIGFLLPLVDANRQTLADKVMSTVCVPLTPRVTDLR